MGFDTLEEGERKQNLSVVLLRTLDIILQFFFRAIFSNVSQSNIDTFLIIQTDTKRTRIVLQMYNIYKVFINYVCE